MTVAGILVTDADSLEAAADMLDTLTAPRYAEVDVDAIFGRDDYADYLADRAEELWQERAAIEDDDPEPEPPARVVPLWASMLNAADGRRGVDARQSRIERRERAFARCA